MYPFLFFRFVLMLWLCIFFSGVYGQRTPLDEEAYRSWRRVDDYHLSSNGKWVIYRYLFYDNDSLNRTAKQTYYLYGCEKGKTWVLENIESPGFFGGGDWLAYTSTDTMTEGKVAMRLYDGQQIQYDNDAELNSEYPSISYLTSEGELVLKNLSSGDSLLLQGIGAYRLYDYGRKVVYTRQRMGNMEICYGPIDRLGAHRVLYRDTTNSLQRFLFSSYEQAGGFQIISDSVRNQMDLYYFSLPNKRVTCLLTGSEIANLEADIYSVEVVSDRFLRYSKLKSPSPRVVKGEKNDSFELELWSWKDAMIPSQQEISGYYPKRLQSAGFIYDRERNLSYSLPIGCGNNLQISCSINPVFGFRKDEDLYANRRDWEHDTRFDLYCVDLRNGEEKLIGKALTRSVRWSPDGEQILFFDNQTMSWVLYHPVAQEFRYLKDEIPFPLQDELYDRPNPAPPYGIAGWDKNNRLLFVYDRFDIWAIDLQNQKKTFCCTNGFGRLRQIRLRAVDPGQDELFFDIDKPLYLTFWNELNKNTGIYKLMSDGRLLLQAEGANDLKVIEQSDRSLTSLCMRQSYLEDRDLWVCDKSYKNWKKITAVNPQQEKYKWGSVKQVEWTNYEGKRNDGLLYLPEDYDSTRCYPTIVSFYETHTPEMHIHPVPGFSQALIDIPTYVGKGYVVFQPDVYFQIGSPGKSAYNAVVSGTQALIDRGIIDPERVGLQGHSWSGFLVAYLVTRTDMFKCVHVGAALTNFTSAYTAIRKESGIACMLMYEDWQCRMGSSLWENPTGYIENSPIFAADKIHTPALIFHCENDGAVTYDDGRNLFLALRRLQRPAWLLNYKGEGHSLTTRAAMKDWTLRMEQFFNHYLKEASMPRWMKEGINIHERGYDQKYELITE